MVVCQRKCGAAWSSKRSRLPHHQVRMHACICSNLTCERGILTRADGSAKWTQDSTIVLAAVYGPRQAQLRREDAEQAVVEVNFKPRSDVQGVRAHACMAGGACMRALQRALHRHTCKPVWQCTCGAGLVAVTLTDLAPMHCTETRDRGRLEGVIRKTLEAIIPLSMHPRTSISVILQVGVYGASLHHVSTCGLAAASLLSCARAFLHRPL